MVSKSIQNLLKVADQIKAGGEPAREWWRGMPFEEEEELAPETERNLPGLLQELGLEEEEEEPPTEPLPKKPARLYKAMKNDELLQIGMEAIQSDNYDVLNDVLQELHGRSSRRAQAVQTALENEIMREPEGPKFQENPEVEGEWGSGNLRDILLSYNTVRLLKIADDILDSLPIEKYEAESPNVNKLIEYGESFLAGLK